MKLYQLIDRYECYDVIYESNDLKEINRYAKHYCEVLTDGECWLALKKLEDGKYRYVKNWTW